LGASSKEEIRQKFKELGHAIDPDMFSGFMMAGMMSVLGQIALLKC
jgi:hypothetical protein